MLWVSLLTEGLLNLHLISVGLTRFNEPNWLVQQALESISLQERVTADVYFLDQQEDPEIALLCEKLSSKNIRYTYRNIPAEGLSFARNFAVRLARTRYLLFYDPDEVLDPLCMHYLTQTLSAGATIVGGKILPIWHKKPLLAARSRMMRELYSILDLGDEVIETDRVFGGNFGIDISALGKENLFQPSLGRQDGRLISGEETALCEQAKDQGLMVIYDGRAVIQHHVLEERINYSWCMKRIFYAGYSRAIRGGKPSLVKPERSLGEYVFLTMIAPLYTAGLINGKWTAITNKVRKSEF